MKEIPLTQGQVALVDDADFEMLTRMKWFAHRERRGYKAVRSVSTPGKRCSGIEYMHRVLLPGFAQIDHRDGNGLNNQRYNLRPATNTQNQQAHRRKALGCSSCYRGVRWTKNAWQAEIKLNGRGIYLGRFQNETDAARAYDDAARKYFAEFASPNFKTI